MHTRVSVPDMQTGLGVAQKGRATPSTPVYSALLPAFRCLIQDTTCATLGDIYASAGVASIWTLWSLAASGVPVDCTAVTGATIFFTRHRSSHLLVTRIHRLFV